MGALGRDPAVLQPDDDVGVGRASAGSRSSTTVVRPARASRSRSAMRASVCASTALVGSTRISTSGSRDQCSGQRDRWRCPPENDRPRSSTSPSSPSGSASRTSVAAAARPRGEHLVVGQIAVRSRGRRADVPVNSRGSVSLTTIRRRTSSSGRSARRDAPEADAVVVDEPTQPVGHGHRLRGVRGDQRGDEPGADDKSRTDVDERATGGRRGELVVRIGDVAVDGEQVEDPARADDGPGGAFHHLGGCPQRDDQEEGVAVERDEVAGLDSAVEHGPGSQPGQQYHEDPRQQDLRGVERGLRGLRPERPPAAPAGTGPGSGRRTPARHRCHAARAGRQRCRRRGRSAARAPLAARPGGSAAGERSAPTRERAPGRRRGRAGPAARTSGAG